MEMTFGSDIFSPEVCLNTENMCLLLVCHVFSERLERVALFDRKITTDSQRFIFLVERLVVVKVEECVRSHNRVMPQSYSLKTAAYASP